jgi:NADPH-dependent ferric siderophore reductase
MYAEVSTVEKLSPSLVRVTLTGGTLDEFEATSATDAYINARFVPADSPLTVPFEPGDVATLAPNHRPRPRRFTIRRWDEETRSLAIDFVAHGDVGFAGSWAQRARPGDRLQFSGPGGSYRPSADVDWHLFAGDESALGAIGASLEQLPADARAMAFVVVDTPMHEIELPTAANTDVVWLHRSTAPDPDTLLADAMAAATFPPGSFDVFVHGEASEVRAVRHHLKADRNVDVDAQSISPYWRRRHTDEDWRAVKRQWLAEQSQDA